MDTYPSSMIFHAEAHQQELLTIAAKTRPIACNKTNRHALPSSVVAVRQFLGSALIALGTRLQTDMSTSAGSMATLRGAH